MVLGRAPRPPARDVGTVGQKTLACWLTHGPKAMPAGTRVVVLSPWRWATSRATSAAAATPSAT